MTEPSRSARVNYRKDTFSVVHSTDMQIERLVSDDAVTYMARGHVDLAAFAAAVAARVPQANSGTPAHGWWRAVPRAGYAFYYVPAPGPGRGAFPATTTLGE